MLRDVTSTPIREGVRLADVAPGKRLNELPFHLPSPSVTPHALNALLQRHGYAMPRLAFDDLDGYLKGVIDLVFEHDGRYYIADWKSNHLGYTAESYGAAAIDEAMLEHGYHLQHLLYALALHRYLSRRLAGYAFARHYGGGAYLFVRGVRPHWRTAAGTQAGVYFHRLTDATLGALDALFAPSRKAVMP
jgi:exodeoxyribonuclease V beta subunit